jgi:hypothetical protein
MASLEGQTIASTYKQLLKITSEELEAGATAKYIEDGDGEDSALSIGTERVGIGTAAPGVQLHIKKNATDSPSSPLELLRLEVTEASAELEPGMGPKLSFYSPANGSSYEGAAISAVKVTDVDSSEATRLVFNVAGDGETSNPSERMTISGGLVGIGTSSPSVQLEVRGSTGTGFTPAMAGHLRLSTAETTIVATDLLGIISFNAPIEASSTDAVQPGAAIWGIAEDTFAGDNNASGLVFGTASTSSVLSTAQERMRISQHGRVGIGETDPGALLHIKTPSTTGSSPLEVLRLEVEDEPDLELAVGMGPKISFYIPHDAASFEGCNISAQKGQSGDEGESALLSFGACGDGETVTEKVTISNTGLNVTSTNTLTFGDAASFIQQSSDGVLRIDGEATVDINASTAVLVSNDLKLDSDNAILGLGAGNDFTITHDGTTGATLAGNPITITSGGAATWSAAAGNLTIDSAAGSLVLDGHTGAQVISSNSGEVDITSAAAVDINATTTVDIDGTAISVDGTDDSNITVTGSNKDLTLSVVGGSTQRLRITSAGTGADSIAFNSSAGGITVGMGGGAGDDFAVDGTTFVVESDTNRVGIGTATPAALLDVYDISTSGDAPAMTFTRNSIGHGITPGTVGFSIDTDCYGFIRCQHATLGGLRIEGFKENVSACSSVLDFGAHIPDSGTYDDTTTDDSFGAINFQAYIGELTGCDADDNIFSIRNGHGGNATRLLLKGDGAFWLDTGAIAGDLPDSDAEDDAQLCRALAHHNILEKTGVIATSLDAGFIKDKWDDFVQYNGDKLADLKIIGRDPDGSPNMMLNMQQITRLHNSTIWQLYTEMQKIKELMYKTMVESIGKEQADKKLDSHDISLLDKKLLN